MPLTQSRPALPQQVWTLGWVSFWMDIASKMVQSVLPLFLVSALGANLVTVGLIEGMAEVVAAGLKVGSGIISDRWQNRKGLAVLGYGLSALVIPCFALATHPVWVLTARVAERFGKGIRVAPRNALVADVTPPEQRGAAYGLRQSLDTVGAFLGPVFATILLAFQNPRFVFWIAAIPALIATGLLFFGIREPSRQSSARPAAQPWKTGLNQLGGRYWSLLGVTALFNLGNSSDAFLLLKAQSVGIPLAIVPLSFALINLTYTISAYPIGWLSDRMSRKGLLFTGLGLFALTYTGLAIAQSPWQVWGLLALYGIHLGMTQGILLAMISERVSAELRGTAFGVLNLVVGVALFLASVLAGLLWQQVGTWAAFMLGTIGAIAAMLQLCFGDHTKS